MNTFYKINTDTRGAAVEFQDFGTEYGWRQGQNLALAVLCGPNSPDSGDTDPQLLPLLPEPSTMIRTVVDTRPSMSSLNPEVRAKKRWEDGWW